MLYLGWTQGQWATVYDWARPIWPERVKAAEICGYEGSTNAIELHRLWLQLHPQKKEPEDKAKTTKPSITINFAGKSIKLFDGDSVTLTVTTG